MSEVNLLEGVLLSDEQIEMLAFAIEPQNIKNYINEHKKEYQSWLIQELSKEFWGKYRDIMAQMLRREIPRFVKHIKSQKYFTIIESSMLNAN